MTIHAIPIDQIHPNPYQTRDGEDAEHVARVAQSIAQVGLLQEPLARLRDGGHDAYELAYGHTRLAAYRLLDEQGEQGYDYLPLKLADLSDLEMFELAVRENSERKDLTPIEEAKAMLVYRDEFKKSSEEIGDLFGLAASTVRNKLRLLDLPEPVQERVSTGELTEGMARVLLTAQKVAPDQVETMAGELASGGYDSPDEVATEIRRQMGHSDNTVEMHDRFSSGEPSGGRGLWPLNWQTPKVRNVTLNALANAYPIWEGAKSAEITQVYLAIESGDLDDRGIPYVASAYELPEQFVSAVIQMMRPPACTNCAYYARLDGTHFCGFKPCWLRKKKAWCEHLLAKRSEKMGIPIYSKSADGPDFEETGWYDQEKWQGWIDEKADHLRLRIAYNKYSAHLITNCHVVQLGSVREEVRQEAEAQRQREAERQARNETDKERREREKKIRELSNAFLWNVAGPVFGRAFEAVNPQVLEDLARAEWDYVLRQRGDIPEDPIERAGFYRRFLAYEIIEDPLGWDELAMGAEHIAGHLESVALTWGIDLPADWHEQALGYALEGVSTETEADDGDR